MRTACYIACNTSAFSRAFRSAAAAVLTLSACPTPKLAATDVRRDSRQRIKGRMFLEWGRRRKDNAPGLGGPCPTYYPAGGPNVRTPAKPPPEPPFVRLRGNQRVRR